MNAPLAATLACLAVLGLPAGATQAPRAPAASAPDPVRAEPTAPARPHELLLAGAALMAGIARRRHAGGPR